MMRFYVMLARLLLPASFVREYLTEIEAAIAARLSGAAGPVARSRVFVRELVDLLRTSAREHRVELAGRLFREGRDGAGGRRRSRARFAHPGGLMEDVRLAVRRMRQAPGFALIVILTLALGIGLNTAVFGAIHALLLRPLAAVEDEGRLVQVYRTWPAIAHGANSIPHYRDLAEQSGAVFDGVAAWSQVTVSVDVGNGPEIATAQMVSANFFDVLGVDPPMGRTFDPAEGRLVGADAVLVLSHELWSSRFGSDPRAIGRTIHVNGRAFTVIGVAPERFRGASRLRSVALWAPLSMQPVLQPGRADRLENRDSNFMNIVARLRPGVTAEQADAALAAVVAGLRQAHPDVYARSGISVVPLSAAGLHAAYGEAPRRFATLLMSVVGLLLLLTCANVANLFLARSERRRREMSVRMSLGASRARLVRQLLTESVVFAVTAGAVGLAVAYLTAGALERVPAAAGLPWQIELEPNAPVLLFALGIALGTALLFGTAPALQGTGAGSTHGPGSGARVTHDPRITQVLVVVQTSLAIVLLLTAALFLRSLASAARLDVGFEAANVLSARIHPELAGRDHATTEALLRSLRDRLEGRPDVMGVTWTDDLPMDASNQTTRVGVPGYVPSPGEQISVDYARVGPEYFSTLRIPLVRGRGIGTYDDSSAAPAVVVNETFAARYWPGRDPIGRMVRTQGREHTVVGVAADAKYGSVGEAPAPFMYLAIAQDFRPAVHLLVRTTHDPAAIAPVVERVLREIDPAVPLHDVRAFENQLDAALLPSRTAAAALGLFGTLGVMLSTLGIYGVIAHSVSRRTREIGIRAALGAPPGRIVTSVLARGARLSLIGSAIGLALGLAVVHAVRGLTYTAAGDPLSVAAVVLLLASFSMIATWIPARRAARIDPMSAVRAE